MRIPEVGFATTFADDGDGGAQGAFQWPRWALERTAADTRDEAVQQWMMVQALGFEVGDLCFSGDELELFARGEPVPDHGLTDVDDVEYLTTVLFALQARSRVRQ